MKLRIWCDSGANVYSKREEIIDLEDLNLTEEQWKSMSEDERGAMAKDVAFAQLDWGYSEVA